MTKKEHKFLDSFQNIKFRYLDLSGSGKPAISTDTQDLRINRDGYDSFFSVNGFSGEDATRDNLICLNSFFVDVDKKIPEEEVSKLIEKYQPTYITETFNGTHWYWVLDEAILKEENEEEWEELVKEWEKIEQTVVNTIPEADTKVKDVTRILRVPNTIYWKKTDGKFKIKGFHKDLSKTYSFANMKELFPETKIDITSIGDIGYSNTKYQKFAEAEKKDFFNRVNEKYPIESRPSFQKLISGAQGTLPLGVGERNQALLIVATLMRQARWSKEKAIEQINKVGWHGIEKERGGSREILNTINSAYANGYTFSYKNEVIAWNMDEEEQKKIQEVYASVQKDRREIDKTRFSNYEHEIVARYPNLKRNEVGIIFNYVNGVYKMMSDQDISTMIMNGLYEDMLWGYRTKKNVADKIACLVSIIPDFKLSEDNGHYVNVKNGLLHIYTRELKPHTPDFISLIQYPVIYDPDAKCPIFEECIKDWTKGEEQEEKALLLQEYSGYILSSSMNYDRALFLVGDGGNGKSTFIETIARVLGQDAVANISLESLYGQYGFKGLIGKRLNIVNEIKGNYYESNKLKQLISGERVTIDVKYKDQFDFRPQAKFVFTVNMMPRIDDASVATERRLCIVYFLNNWRNNPNTKLRHDWGSLAEELSGILNWMLDGAKKLAEDGKFLITKEMTRALAEYREENSSTEGFVGECLEFEEGESITLRELYDKYKQFCTSDGRKFKSKISFSKEIKMYAQRSNKFEFISRQSGSDVAQIKGVCFKNEWKDSYKDF